MAATRERTTVHGTTLPRSASANRDTRMAAWLRANPGADKMYSPDVAWVLGIDPHSVHKYSSTAERNRENGTPGPRDMPALANRERGRHGPPAPYWPPGVITAWIAARFHPGKPGNAEGGGLRSPAPSPERKRPGPRTVTRKANAAAGRSPAAA